MSIQESLKEHFEEHYKCAICVQLLHNPITIMCQHTFCRSCLTENVCKGNKKCPICQKSFCLPANGANFVINNSISELMSKIYTADEIIEMNQEREKDSLRLDLKDQVKLELRKELEDCIRDNVLQPGNVVNLVNQHYEPIIVNSSDGLSHDQDSAYTLAEKVLTKYFFGVNPKFLFGILLIGALTKSAKDIYRVFHP